MKKVEEIIKSPYRGSTKTYESVKEQVRQRYGDAVAEEYDPFDTAPFSTWFSRGYYIKKREKAFKSITFLEVKDENGEIKKIPRVVNLFHRLQVKKAD